MPSWLILGVQSSPSSQLIGDVADKPVTVSRLPNLNFRLIKILKVIRGVFIIHQKMWSDFTDILEPENERFPSLTIPENAEPAGRSGWIVGPAG